MKGKTKLTYMLTLLILLNAFFAYGCKDNSTKSAETNVADIADTKIKPHTEEPKTSSIKEEKYQKYIKYINDFYKPITIDNEIKYVQIRNLSSFPQKMASKEEFFYILQLEEFLSTKIQQLANEYGGYPREAFEEKCGDFPKAKMNEYQSEYESRTREARLNFAECRMKVLADIGPCIYIEFERSIRDFESNFVPDIFLEFSNEFKKHNEYLLQNLYYYMLEYTNAEIDTSRSEYSYKSNAAVNWKERLEAYEKLNINPRYSFWNAQPAGIDFEMPIIVTSIETTRRVRYAGISNNSKELINNSEELIRIGCNISYQDINFIQPDNQ